MRSAHKGSKIYEVLTENDLKIRLREYGNSFNEQLYGRYDAMRLIKIDMNMFKIGEITEESLKEITIEKQ